MDSRCKDTKKLQIFLPFPNYFLTLQQIFDFILDADIGSSTDDLFAMQISWPTPLGITVIRSLAS